MYTFEGTPAFFLEELDYFPSGEWIIFIAADSDLKMIL